MVVKHKCGTNGSHAELNHLLLYDEVLHLSHILVRQPRWKCQLDGQAVAILFLWIKILWLLIKDGPLHFIVLLPYSPHLAKELLVTLTAF